MSEFIASTAEFFGDIFYGDETTTKPHETPDGGLEFTVLRRGTPTGVVTINPTDRPQRVGDDDDHEGLTDTWAADLATTLWEVAMESAFDDEPLIGTVAGHADGSFSFTSTDNGETILISVSG